MTTNLLWRFTLLLTICALSTFKSNANNNQTQALPIKFDKFTFIQGSGNEGTLYYATGGEVLTYSAILTNDQSQTFKGQWGIAIGFYNTSSQLTIETIIYESQEFEMAKGSSITEKVKTNRLPDKIYDGMRFIFPIIKTKTSEWQIATIPMSPVELFPQRPAMLVGHLEAPDKQDKGILFKVVAPIEYKDAVAAQKNYQILLYRLSEALGRFNFEYEKVCTISESKDGNTFACRIPNYLEPGNYRLTIAPTDAPNIFNVSTNTDQFDEYSPWRGANNYKSNQEIVVSEVTHTHNIQMTGNIEILSSAADYTEIKADFTNFDNRLFSGWIEPILVNQLGEQVRLAADYAPIRDNINPNERKQKTITIAKKSPWIFKGNTYELSDGNYKMYFASHILDEQPLRIVGVDQTITNEVTINIRSTTNIANASETNANIRIYPNPTTDILNIEAGDDMIQSVMIYDTSGRLLLTQEYPASNIDIRGLTKGTYILKLKTSKTTSTHKINKK